MKAAILESRDAPPRYADFPDPPPAGPGELEVEVLAAGLHHLTLGRARGAHYSGAEALPLVPGVDGVGRGADGKLRYFVQRPGQLGTLAEKTVIALAQSIELPGHCDPSLLAAAMNPAMASWLALRCRARLDPGQEVLVLGATGCSGRLAVQVARHLGAARIVAAGRDPARLAQLPALGATDTVPLGDPRLGALAREVDVVLDFLWGDSAVAVLQDLLWQRKDRDQRLTWVHVGSMAGEVAALPGALLRSANLALVGSGHGAVSGAEMRTELPALARELARGSFHLDLQARPLRDVQQAWIEAASSPSRIVLQP